MLWDIFCRVIDNYGDIGVCWRLSADLAARGENVRLWIDDASALEWMAPGARQGRWPGVSVHDWAQSANPAHLDHLPLADVWVEAFGCEIDPAFVAHSARQIAVQCEPDTGGMPALAPPAWINLEYLSAEPYVERSHGLESPVMFGPARGWRKRFFYPGFTAHTGGLLREPHLSPPPAPMAPDAIAQFLQTCAIAWNGERLVSLFCYSPRMLPSLLRHLRACARPTLLLVTPGKAQTAIAQALRLAGMPPIPPAGSTAPGTATETIAGNVRIALLPAVSQDRFDMLLRSCDLNFVRGEDSVIRAIWAGKPFVWHIYPQDDAAHIHKLEAFLQQMQWGPSIDELHRAWNDTLLPQRAESVLQQMTHDSWEPWQAKVRAVRTRLLEMGDLTQGLIQFVRKNR